MEGVHETRSASERIVTVIAIGAIRMQTHMLQNVTKWNSDVACIHTFWSSVEDL